MPVSDCSIAKLPRLTLLSLWTLELLLTPSFISSTLAPNEENMGGKSYLNKSLSVENCHSKSKWTHYPWLLKSPMSGRIFTENKERTKLSCVAMRGLITRTEHSLSSRPLSCQPEGETADAEPWVPDVPVPESEY